MNVQFRFITAQDAERIASWRYPPPYDFYNWYPTDPPEDLLQAWPPFIVADDGLDQLAGFACFGATARVPTDQDAHVYDDHLLDVGLGLRPDLVGHGHGLEFVNAIVDAASSWLGPRGYRLTVASFNVRAIRVYERAGFVESSRFIGRAHGNETEFVVMHRFNVNGEKENVMSTPDLEANNSRDLVCPVCAATMITVRRENVVIDRCPDCRGVFLDRGELEKLVAVEIAHAGGAVFEQPADELDDPDQSEKLSTRRSFFSELFDKD